MGEKKTKNKRERCPAGSHWNEEKQRCVGVRKRKDEKKEEAEEDIDENEDED